MDIAQRSARSALAVAMAALAFLGIAAGTAQAATSGGQPPVTKLSVDVSAQRFVVHGDRVIARGPVVATATKPDGTTKVVRQQVKMQVEATGNCRILRLHLAQLYLNLLGLKVRTSEINVSITGDPNGGVLGQLFCSLSRGITLDRHALARRSARSINHRLQNRPLRVLAFHTPVRPQQTGASGSTGPLPQGRVITVPPGECEVLDLTLGPLNLDLLGLMVDVFGETRNDPIEVLLTGDPNAGILGQLLCGLTGPPTP